MAELADARDLKSLGSDTVPVRSRSAAYNRSTPFQACCVFFVKCNFAVFANESSIQMVYSFSFFYLFYGELQEKMLVSSARIVYNVVYACECVKIEGMQQEIKK